jgi:hypothetical protein
LETIVITATRDTVSKQHGFLPARLSLHKEKINMNPALQTAILNYKNYVSPSKVHASLSDKSHFSFRVLLWIYHVGWK